MLATPSSIFCGSRSALARPRARWPSASSCPFARSAGLGALVASLALPVSAAGNAGGRIFSGWLSDSIGRLRTLQVMVLISAIAMPTLFACARARGPLLHAGGGGVLVLRHAALCVRVHDGRLLRHPESRDELRRALHRVGRGRHSRPRALADACSTRSATTDTRSMRPAPWRSSHSRRCRWSAPWRAHRRRRPEFTARSVRRCGCGSSARPASRTRGRRRSRRSARP